MGDGDVDSGGNGGAVAGSGGGDKAQWMRNALNVSVAQPTGGGDAGTATSTSSGQWSFDPTDPSKKPPINLNLPDSYKYDPSKNPPTPAGASTDGGTAAGGGDAPQTSIVIDPMAKTVETQLEVDVTYATFDGGKGSIQLQVTVHIGADGINAIEAQNAISEKLKDQLAGGAISDLTISAKFGGQVGFEKSTANRLLPNFSASLKAALSANLGIPSTSIKIPVELSLSVDPHGNVTPGVNVTVFTF
jgi:hypothetical protein